jgi:predicted metalloprotease
MKLDDREESGNVEDRRGMGMKTGVAVGGGVAGIIVVIICLVLGVDPQQFLGQQGAPPGNDQPGQTADPEEQQLAHFTKVVFGDTERV